MRGKIMDSYATTILARIDDAKKQQEQQTVRQNHLEEQAYLYFNNLKEKAKSSVEELKNAEERYSQLRHTTMSPMAFRVQNMGKPYATVEVKLGDAHLDFVVKTARHPGESSAQLQGSIVLALDSDGNLIVRGKKGNDDPTELRTVDQAMDFLFKPVVGV